MCLTAFTSPSVSAGHRASPSHPCGWWHRLVGQASRLSIMWVARFGRAAANRVLEGSTSLPSMLRIPRKPVELVAHGTGGRVHV